MGLRRLLESRIHGDRQGSDSWDTVLRSVSRVYELGVQFREWCLAHGILKTYRLPRPVISVGNLTVGGTGKTPTVIYLARLLRESGYTVAVLSRGYGRKGGGRIRAVSDGQKILCGVTEAGDEPYMMARRLDGVWIWVGTDRHRVGLAAWERCRPDVFLLDDGFQHRKLHRDLDIVVLRFPRPLENGRLLPAGPLRETPTALGRADLIIINTGGVSSGEAEALSQIRTLCPSVHLIKATHHPVSLRLVGEEKTMPLNILKGLRVVMVCGIGHPEGFKATLRLLGAQVVQSLSFPDHYWYTSADMDRIHELSRDVDAVVTTEKDAWKMQDTGSVGDQIWTLCVEWEVHEDDLLAEYVEGTLKSVR